MRIMDAGVVSRNVFLLRIGKNTSNKASGIRMEERHALEDVFLEYRPAKIAGTKIKVK